MKLIFRAAAGALLALASIANARADTPWKLVKTYPHDAQAFTEGLFYLDGTLYESTGLNGQSQIRQVELKSGRVLRKVDLERRYFGEGIVNWGDRLISLTWRHHQGFVWRLTDFQQLSLFAYPGEGWALTQDGQNIIMSDGTAELRFLNPYTMDEVKRITVTWNGQPVERLNELEWVKGEIYANVWYDDRIARIDPATGAVIDWIDLSRLRAANAPGNSDAVVNGIAYDAEHDRLFVTGKLWPRLYEIKLRTKAK